ncbi:MAG: hypothetical protein U0X75_11160 [Acidobacteriota bacterium]
MNSNRERVSFSIGFWHLQAAPLLSFPSMSLFMSLIDGVRHLPNLDGIGYAPRLCLLVAAATMSANKIS